MSGIAVFGGTFNPIHIGHVQMICEVNKLSFIDKILVMPDNIPPHKQTDFLADNSHRINMCKLATENISKAVIDDREIKRGGKSYTILTLEHFLEESCDITLLCGTDMFLTLERWYRGEDILRMAHICCLCRDDDPASMNEIEKTAAHYRDTYATTVVLPPFSPLVISSTEIRARIAAGQSTNDVLPASVRSHIDAHGLYRA